MYFNFSNPWMIILLVIMIMENLKYYVSTPGALLGLIIFYSSGFDCNYIS